MKLCPFAAKIRTELNLQVIGIKSLKFNFNLSQFSYLSLLLSSLKMVNISKWYFELKKYENIDKKKHVLLKPSYWLDHGA